MGCDVFLWRFVTFNEVSQAFSKNKGFVFQIQCRFISMKMALKTYFICFPLFYQKKFEASLINFICIILFITTNVHDEDLIKFVAAVVLMCEFKGDR